MKTEPKKLIKNMNKGGKRGKEDTLHCSPSTANVLLTEPKKLEWSEKVDDMFFRYQEDKWECELNNPQELKDFIQSLIQSTKEETIREEQQRSIKVVWNNVCGQIREETIREVMGLECMKNEPDDDDAFAKDAEIAMDNYNRNQLRNQIKTEINSLLKK